LGDPEASLGKLFREIDLDGSDLLSREEFKIFLGNMGITFSRKMWRQIFHQVDENYDDEISFNELFIFLFPNHDKALAEELKRVKALRLSVKERLSDYKTLTGDDFQESVKRIEARLSRKGSTAAAERRSLHTGTLQ